MPSKRGRNVFSSFFSSNSTLPPAPTQPHDQFQARPRPTNADPAFSTDPRSHPFSFESTTTVFRPMTPQLPPERRVDFAPRPESPPPDYDAIEATHRPRPIPERNESAPELRQQIRHIEPPGLGPRAQTAPPAVPMPASGPSRARRRHPGDLDRIDELDESNPLGSLMHHDGPFRINAMLATPPTASEHPPRAQGHGPSGSLGISPGDILPPSFLQRYQQPLPQPRPSLNHHPQAPYLGQASPGSHHAYAQPHFPLAQPMLPPPVPLHETQYDPIEPVAEHGAMPSEDLDAAYGGIAEEESEPPIEQPHFPPQQPPPGPSRLDFPRVGQHPPSQLALSQQRVPAPGSSQFGRPDPRMQQQGASQMARLGAPLLPQQIPDRANCLVQTHPKFCRNKVDQVCLLIPILVLSSHKSHDPNLPGGSGVGTGHSRPSEHDRARRHASYQPPASVPQMPAGGPHRASLPPSTRSSDNRSEHVSVASSTNPNRPLPRHLPKQLVMPTPLQGSSPLPSSHPPPVQFQPAAAQIIQNPHGGRLLRKRSSVQHVQQPLPAPIMPPKQPSRPVSYMEPPPTIPMAPITRPPPVQDKKRPKRLLSKRRTDL
ncbi:hypothetical protein HMN09_00618200 [Mycena chlorophos]|uniref:Uncharacterized protein n=1 Tax=Mycena chlorophos TaxID=658473 RepID=A0A8H6T699_MYCCL|nr:hypothetical protein HMN09_00618200 [Mycena chlorophos]